MDLDVDTPRARDDDNRAGRANSRTGDRDRVSDMRAAGFELKMCKLSDPAVPRRAH